MPSSRIFSTSAKRRWASAADRAEVGSSRISSRGRVARARARISNWRSEMPSSLTSRRSTASLQPRSSPAWISRARARTRRPFRNGFPRFCASSSNTRFSATERPGTMPSPMRWCTVWMPNCRAASGDWRAAVSPATRTCPPCPVCTPDRILISVDLPAPFAPSSATTLPGAMSRETEASTVLPPKAMLTSVRPTAGVSVGDIRYPVGGRDLRQVQRGQCLPQLVHVLDLLLAQEVLGDGDGRELHRGLVQLAGQFQGGRPDDGGADRGRVGARRGAPRAVGGGHLLDVGVGDVRAEDLHLVLELLVLDGEDRALGEFVVGSEDAGHVRVLGERGGDQGNVVGGRGVGDLADLELLLPCLRGEFLRPDGVPLVQGRVAGDVDVPDLGVLAEVLG